MKQMYLFLGILSLCICSCSNPKQAQSMTDPAILNGAWEVIEISTTTIALNELYPEKKPMMVFDAPNLKLSGNTGCNNFNGPYSVKGSVIDFTAPMGMTRMMCPGEGETTFMSTLQKVNGWTVRDETLRLMTGDLVVMQLKKMSK